MQIPDMPSETQLKIRAYELAISAEPGNYASSPSHLIHDAKEIYEWISLEVVANDKKN